MAQIIEFANHHPWLIAGLFAAWIAVMVYELRLRAGGITHVSAADAVRLINKGARDRRANRTNFSRGTS